MVLDQATTEAIIRLEVPLVKHIASSVGCLTRNMSLSNAAVASSTSPESQSRINPGETLDFGKQAIAQVTVRKIFLTVGSA